MASPLGSTATIKYHCCAQMYMEYAPFVLPNGYIISAFRFVRNFFHIIPNSFIGTG